MSGPTLPKEWRWKSKDTVNTYIRLSKREAEEAVPEAHPYFKEQDGQEDSAPEEVLKLLRGLSPEAQRNLLEIVRNGFPEVEA